MLAVTWQQIVGPVVGLAAFTAALGALSRLKLVKWLWRHLVSAPLTQWFDALLEAKVAPIRYQLETNNGSSIKDAVGRLEDGQATMLAHLKSSDDALAIHIERSHKET